MSESILIKNAQIVTVDEKDVCLNGDLLVEDGRIKEIGSVNAQADIVIDASGRTVIPGFVQTHIHLCQTLFRGWADDLELIDWLKQRVWPMEAAHTKESLYASACLGIAELIRGGTTAALTMETVNHTEAVFEAVERSGFRATVGKCMMDRGEEAPKELIEDRNKSIKESLKLLDRWHNRAGGRIRYAFAPRFALSCSRELLEEVAELAREHQVMIHTHASENRDEIRLVEQETGQRNIQYLAAVGIAGGHVGLAHCVWVDENEMQILAETGSHVLHCPSSNLKLASGIAPIAEMLERGIQVSLGADGAPCNNRLDMFTEMRAAALLQKVRFGSRALPARAALRLATVEGARALGLENEIGSISAGKRADLCILNLNRLHTTPHPDPISTIVFAAEMDNVETVIIDGRIVMRDGSLLTLNEEEVRAVAEEQSRALAQRAGQ